MDDRMRRLLKKVEWIAVNLKIRMINSIDNPIFTPKNSSGLRL
jgi:hypothetical protein